MRIKIGRIVFWVLTAFLLALAFFALSYTPREPGWKGEPGLRLSP